MGKHWTPESFNVTVISLTSGSLPWLLAAERPRGFFFWWALSFAGVSTRLLKSK